MQRDVLQTARLPELGYMPRRRRMALSVTSTISHRYSRCRPFKPLFRFQKQRTRGAVLLSVLLLEMFWMWKETIVSTWPFNTASAALQRERERGGAHTRTCFSFTDPKSRALSPSTELGRDRKEKQGKMWNEKEPRETGFQYFCLSFTIELLKSEDSH